MNSLKFFSIDDKQFKNEIKGFNRNVVITERKDSINKNKHRNEIFKININEYKTYHAQSSN